MMTSTDRLKVSFLAVLLILGLIGCTARVRVGSNEWTFDIGPSPTIQVTYTPYPTFTACPSYTPRATYTPRPALTPNPTYTLLPSLTPGTPTK